ncbi:hypothetical protein C5B96_08210 [Subtercola sp. Z020]|uniref:hypothetical protein n=1 Tax=Subtercola sp. Z020 TaxID=2080582 RepID=UPI000CE8F63A|nr:hypothetical protein [Subtercola sp. Z020]PPF83343.1 hypothetical protein C5B96_08210 [Subtercola sp. Z020]
MAVAELCDDGSGEQMHAGSTRSRTTAAAAALLTLLVLLAGLLTPFQPAAHAAAAAPTAATATVSGTITSTQNPGVGAPNVQISLREAVDGVFTQLTRTDAAGHYTLTFQGSGTTQLAIGAAESGSLPKGPYELLLVSVSYTAGEATTGVDFLVRYMPALRVVATYDDAARTPVDRVAHITGQQSYRRESRNTGTTGAVFVSLLEGVSYRLEDRTGVGVGFKAQIVTMGTQDITVRVLLSASERGSVVSVTVGTDDGTSQSATVTLTGVGQSTRSYTATPVTGSTSAYSFPNVVPGTYQLKAAPTDTTYPSVWYADSYTAAGATTVTVGPAGSPLDLALTIHKALTLTLPGSPVITGSATLDGTLTATTSGWGPAPVTLSYSWLRNGQAIAGATAATYRVTGDDLGVPLSVVVTAAKPGYASASKTSAAVTPPPGFVTAPTPTIPQPAITGTVLTAKVGTWSPTPTAFVYTWYRDGVAIPGATTVTHRLVTADSGSRITLSATASRAGFSSITRTSAPTEVVAYRFASSVLPKITGQAAVGRTLTASTGTVTPAPTAYSYQWLRNGATVSGATTASYTVRAIDEGAIFSVTVTATRSGYQSLAQTSAATAAVLKVSPPPRRPPSSERRRWV